MSTLRFLRTFLAVARHGSFSDAAEHVGLTQAAVSFQMRSLETELGRELFDRTGRLALLNTAGRELLPEVTQLLDLYEHIRRPRAPSGDLAGSVAVGAIVSCMGGLSKVISGLKKNHPHLEVRLLSGKASELAAQVEAAELDAAFIVETPRKNATTHWTALYEEPLVVLAHPQAIGERAEDILANNPFLRFNRRQRTGLQIDRVLRRMGIAVHDYLELNAIETLVELVRQEVGVTLLPQLYGANWLTGGNLSVIALPPELGSVHRSIGMLERREHPLQAITQAICANYLEFSRGKPDELGKTA